MRDAKCFAGIFDPDGRPWTILSSGQLPRYQEALEAALKAAALTQRSTPLPVGYFLDNPGLQRAFLKYSDASNESKAFRAVMKDLLYVAIDEPLASDLKSAEDWRLIRHYWITGEVTNRNEFVYLNCIDDVNARDLLKSQSAGRFEQDLDIILLMLGIDSSRLFHLWGGLELEVRPYSGFSFGEEISSRLLSGKERFSSINEALFEKLKIIEEKCSDADQRVSRSLLRSKDKCLQLGVPEDMTISRDEYVDLVFPLQHYHHIAFAKALGIGAVFTPQTPVVDEQVQSVLSIECRRLFREINEIKGLPAVRFPLSRITFEDIYKLRLGKQSPMFRDSLNQLHDATIFGNREEYRAAFTQHSRLVRSGLVWDFEDVKSQEFAKSLDETLFTEEATANGIFGALKYAFTFAKDLIPNFRKRLQVQRFFRRVESAHSQSDDGDRSA
ncbi:MAG: hypothetical protein GVY36_10825 [Verrucomicrobia bacterium]|jgi:hypothetical protein|nr:hypothetical protein [Verrucomicrobiota bacterium]